MLNSLYKIGEQLYKEYGSGYLIFSRPKISEKKEGHYALEIIFNCDNNEILISRNNLKSYGDKSYVKYKNIMTQSGNAKKIYVTVELKKVLDLEKSLLPQNGSKYGELFQTIESSFQELLDTQFAKAVKLIGEKFSFTGTINEEISQKIELANNEEIVLVFASIISKDLDVNEATPIFGLEGYNEFINKKFFEPQNENEKLCYVSGEKKNYVEKPDFNTRYNLNYLFVSTQINSLTNFTKPKANKNYQLDFYSRLYLDIASKYFLENMRIKIGGLQSVVIPSFLDKTDFDFKNIEPKLKAKVDIVFNYQELNENFIEILEDEIDEDLFWLNFITFITDGGKGFKIISQIKDVPFFRFNRVINVLQHTGEKFNKYLHSKFAFNLNSVYNLIPVRKIKGEGLNKAFLIIRDILENRKISTSDLLESFSELIQVHYYDRYKFYSKYIRKFGKNNFDFAIHFSVFSYFVLFNALIELGLLEKHNFNNNLENKMSEETKKSFGEKIEEFFETMKYSQPQKALFYLGRMLNTIAFEQTQKQHLKKPILNKLNFNGMDKNEIIRLHSDLFEKARQYGIVDKVEFDNGKFTSLFDVNSWKLPPQETLFFILAGYSFKLAIYGLEDIDDNKNNDNNNSEEQNDVN
jgi:CRISPR-associated protein Csh1